MACIADLHNFVPGRLIVTAENGIGKVYEATRLRDFRARFGIREHEQHRENKR